MKTKRTLPALLALALVAATLAATGCRDSDQSGLSRQYTCPMKEHSDVVKDKPGDCPKCGMKLVEKK